MLFGDTRVVKTRAAIITNPKNAKAEELFDTTIYYVGMDDSGFVKVWV